MQVLLNPLATKC